MSNNRENKSKFSVLELLFEKRKKFERFATLYVRDTEIARDIMMDSFKYVLENIDTIDANGNIEAYMFRVVQNKSLDWLKREQIRLQAENSMRTDAEFEISMRIATLQAFDPDWMYDNELQARVRAAMAKLPDRTRQIFLMNRNDDLPYKEIAERLGVSTKTIEFHITKALRSLRTDLGDTLLIYIFLFF